MDFARKQLEKYGWSDGKGLGKHENGISEALKPKLKRSVAGVGHDPASEFNEHWWTALYDKAAGNVQVEEKNGKTKKIKTKDSEFKITNSTWKIQKKSKDSNDLNQEEYSEYFVKKAVLTSGGSKTEKVKDSDSDEEVEKRDVFKMTDEELFAACEGRTAHKGARHGLKALGKLARIEQQEQMLLSQPQYRDYSHAKKIKENITKNDLKVVEDTNLNSDGDVEVKKKKKKRKHCVSNEIVKETKHNPSELEPSDCKVAVNNNFDDYICDRYENIIDEQTKKFSNEIDFDLLNTSAEIENKRSKKKSKNFDNVMKMDVDENDDSKPEESVEKIKKKSKKNKRKDL